MTKKRTIENYVSCAAIARIAENQIVMAAGVDPDYGDIANVFSDAVRAARGAHGQNLAFAPVDHEGVRLQLTKTKKIITTYLLRHMTIDEVRARASYVNDAGENCNEIVEWLTAINEYI